MFTPTLGFGGVGLGIPYCSEGSGGTEPGEELWFRACGVLSRRVCSSPREELLSPCSSHMCHVLVQAESHVMGL